MANIIDYYVDVLASSPEEINRIATRLKEPSSELVDWVAGRWQQERGECAENVRRLVAFEPKHNLFYQHESVNKARRFHNSFKRWTGIVDSHLFEVSKEFPTAMFMVEYYDMCASYSGKRVILAGELLHEVYDGNHHAQGIDWALLDIFAPFRAEYELGLPFGSLWDEWVVDMGEALSGLKQDSHEKAQSPVPEQLVFEFADELPREAGEPCNKRMEATLCGGL